MWNLSSDFSITLQLIYGCLRKKKIGTILCYISIPEKTTKTRRIQKPDKLVERQKMSKDRGKGGGRGTQGTGGRGGRGEEDDLAEEALW